jgi:chemotaxis-related protein WspB
MLLITCQAGAERYAVQSRHVAEVLPQANLQRLSGSPPWLAGLLVYRGSATPVMDLTQLVGGSACPNRFSSRILMLQTELDGAERRFGLLAEHVGLREVAEGPDESAHRPGEASALGSLCLDAQGVFQLLDPGLLATPERRELLFPVVKESP